MNLSKIRKWRPSYLIVAFFIPFCLMLGLMILQDVTPFGKQMMLYSDEWHQYFPFFKAFRAAIRSGDSLLYSWDVGMGLDYLGLISYYLASPLNLVSVILPDILVLPYFTMLLPIKLGLASLFFAYFLKKMFNKDDISIAIFGSFYGLCAWALGYQWNIMWLDTFALLPLVALGTICLLRDRKVALYTISLALSILCNYYIGFFTCIFVLILFICYQICRCKSIGRFCLDFFRIAVFSLIAISMTAFLTLPAWAALGKTYSSVNSFPESFWLNIVDYELFADARTAWSMAKSAKEAGKESIEQAYAALTNSIPLISEDFRAIGTVFANLKQVIDVTLKEWINTFVLGFAAFWKSIPPVWEGMKQVAGNMSGGLTPSFMEGLPNVYSGVSTLFLAFLFLMAKNVKLRDKLCSIFLLVFLMISCVVRELDYIWHGFHFPNMIPHRFSFIFSFVMLYMAYRAYLSRYKFKLVHILFAGALTFEIFTLSKHWDTLQSSWNSLGELLPSLYTIITEKIAGNAQAVERTIDNLKTIHYNHVGNYVFMLFNGGFLLLYVSVFLVALVRNKVSKESPREERRKIILGNFRHRRLCTVLLLVVMSFELLANVANFERNYSYTSTENYPQGGSYTASMIRYMKERDNPLFYRVETTRTQTLNDGALNGYHGISAFTSSANVKTTNFVNALGLAGQDNWNRYSFEEGSPVTNLFLNLKYMLERDGNLEENPYFTDVHHYGDVHLLENSYYLPLGFLADSELAAVQMTMSSSNAFPNQNLIFAAATGIAEDVWTKTPQEWLTIEGQGANITYRDGAGVCYYTADAAGGAVIYRYNIQSEGFLCLDVNMAGRNNFNINLNNRHLFSESVVLPQTFSVCQVHPGDVVEVRVSCPGSETSNMSIQAALLNDAVFKAGYEKLNASTLELTKFETDKMSGTIHCNRDGLLYTSIPDDGNWKAYVDGKAADIVLIGGGMIGLNLTEGTHEIRFVYRNMDFVYGLLLSFGTVIPFLGFVYLYDRKSWNERIKKLFAKKTINPKE